MISKKPLLILGILGGISTPLIIVFAFNSKLREVIPFGLIHAIAIIRTTTTNFDIKKNYQKIMLLVAFICFPILLTAFTTQIFASNAFPISFFSAWVYVLGVVGWQLNLQ